MDSSSLWLVHHVPIVLAASFKSQSTLQALPMVTILVGAPNGSAATANVVTLTENIGQSEERRVAFDTRSVEPSTVSKCVSPLFHPKSCLGVVGVE